MSVICERLLSPTPSELEQIQHIYETSFPLAERKPFAHFLPRIPTGQYLCLVVRSPNTPHQIVAFAFLMLLPETPLAFLEYMAVAVSSHGQGIGSQFFRALVTYVQEQDLAEGIVWEVEPPTENPLDAQNRRIRFYARLGAQMLDLSTVYAMPNYQLQTGGVPLRLMQLPLQWQPTRAQVAALITGIYHLAYPEWGALRDEILEALAGLPT